MKKLDKKLRLHRETVRHLDAKEIARIQGGIDWTGCVSGCTTCPTDEGYTQVRQLDAGW